MTGHRFLGGCIGDPFKRDDFVHQKAQQWSNHVWTFAAVISSQPQVAFAAVTKSLQFEWTFLMRDTPTFVCRVGALPSILFSACIV